MKKASVDRCLEYFPNYDLLIDELARTLYQERARVTQKPWKADPVDEREYWGNIKREVINLNGQLNGNISADQEQAKEILTSIASRYANEITGTFDPSIYEFAKKALPVGFSRLLKTSIGQNFKERLNNEFNIKDRFHFTGDLETIRELGTKATLVMVPTHFSNIDSPVIGWAIQELGLPAFIYGAGLNLFGIKILAYFMNRLGAYKIDRRKKNQIYLETLKMYSTLALHQGAHSLFFPGGTRSRSGAIEDKLKLGLLGTAMEAQYLNIANAPKGESGKKIVIVPVVLNYHFVLEAPSLIEQHLKQIGREYYFAENDEFSTSFKIARFIFKFLTRSSELAISFGSCMDLFGNRVDKDGNSFDDKGQKIDIRQYYLSHGELKNDKQRNGEYIRLLGEKIVKSYRRNNIVFSSHLLAFAAFEILKKRFKKLDIYALLRIPEEDREISYMEFAQNIEALRKEIFKMADAGEIIAPEQISWEVSKIIDHGMDQLGLYHDQATLLYTPERNITTQDMKLLYFYHNRLEGFGLEQYVG
ncbi:MAG: 1-acyl-sn-glycerol-3-phosphate acyltransferase [Chitinophagales bacterium]